MADQREIRRLEIQQEGTTPQEREDVRTFVGLLFRARDAIIKERGWSTIPDGSNFASRFQTPHLLTAHRTGLVLHPDSSIRDGRLTISFWGLPELRGASESSPTQYDEWNRRVYAFTDSFLTRIGFAPLEERERRITAAPPPFYALVYVLTNSTMSWDGPGDRIQFTHKQLLRREKSHGMPL